MAPVGKWPIGNVTTACLRVTWELTVSGVALFRKATYMTGCLEAMIGHGDTTVATVTLSTTVIGGVAIRKLDSIVESLVIGNHLEADHAERGLVQADRGVTLVGLPVICETGLIIENVWRRMNRGKGSALI
jgi:hypothetical protein